MGVPGLCSQGVPTQCRATLGGDPQAGSNTPDTRSSTAMLSQHSCPFQQHTQAANSAQCQGQGVICPPPVCTPWWSNCLITRQVPPSHLESTTAPWGQEERRDLLRVQKLGLCCAALPGGRTQQHMSGPKDHTEATPLSISSQAKSISCYRNQT